MRVIIPIADGRNSLIDVAGRPVVGHILDWVDGMDLSEVIIVTSDFDDEVKSYIDANYAERFPVRYIRQTEPNGSGGAVWLALRDIPRSHSPVLIVNGDRIPVGDGAVDFKRQMSAAEKPPFSTLGIMAVENPEDYGVVELDKRGWVRRLSGKPDNPMTNLVMSGIFYLKRADYLFDALDTLIRYNVRLKGEFHLTGGLIYMFQFGESIQTQFVRTCDYDTYIARELRN